MFCSTCGAKNDADARFCVSCGAMIGAVPNAQAMAATTAPSQATEFFSTIFNTFKSAIKSPATTMGELSKKTDHKTALGFMAVHSIAMLLVFIFSILLILIKDNDILKYIEFPYAAVIMACLIVPFGLTAVFAGILLFFTNVCFKEKNTYKQMICVASSSSFANSMALLLAAVIILFVGVISPQYATAFAIFIISCGVILSYFMVGAGLKGVTNLDDNKRLKTLFLAFSTMTIATYLVMRVVVPLCTSGFGFDASNIFAGLL